MKASRSTGKQKSRNPRRQRCCSSIKSQTPAASAAGSSPMWLWQDFGNIIGTALFVGTFLALYYISKLAAMAWAENSPYLQKRMFWVSEIQALAAILIFVIFLSG